ncbi:MAG: hypothetical protein ACW99J_16125, partial [Candidatus Thorarchaeota archaeon]|jgi:hypothetical protein
MSLGKYKEAKVYDATKVFRFESLQTFVNILIALRRNNLLIEDLVHYVDTHKKHMETPYKRLPTTKVQIGTKGRPCQKRIKPELSRACTNCDTPMEGFEVNTRPCNQVGESLRIQWICSKCDLEEFE